MERSRVTLITLIAVVLYSQMRISGALVHMRVKPGDDITLCCDCAWKVGFTVLWFRNNSHERQLITVPGTDNLSPTKEFLSDSFARYSLLWNQTSNSHDLLVKNITEADLGIYYCSLYERNISIDQSGIIRYKNVFHFGNTATSLTFHDSVSSCVNVSTASPPERDCSVCWKLLISVCPVCVLVASLISSTSVYCLCRKTAKVETERDQKDSGQKRRQDTRRHKEVGEDVCYASLEIQSMGEKRVKKKRIKNSDFSTYSEVRIERK